jgi:hypothetical protein
LENIYPNKENFTMPTKSFPYDVLDQGRAVLEAWRSIDPALKVGDMAAEALEADLNQAVPIDARIKRLEAELAEARTERESLWQAIWDKIKRARRGMQSIFGDDSPQYKIIGGTRVSDRKPTARKSAAAKSEAPTS